jgi:hypothetical protein
MLIKGILLNEPQEDVNEYYGRKEDHYYRRRACRR